MSELTMINNSNFPVEFKLDPVFDWTLVAPHGGRMTEYIEEYVKHVTFYARQPDVGMITSRSCYADHDPDYYSECYFDGRTFNTRVLRYARKSRTTDECECRIL